MTTWNPSDQLNTTLSGGNLIATCNSTAVGNGVRTTTSKSAGKLVIQCTMDMAAGFTNISMTFAAGPYDDSAINQLELYYDSGGPYWLVRDNPGGFLGIDSTSAGPTGTGDVIQFYLNWTGNLLYVKANGNNLFGGDPSANTGGISRTFQSNWFFTAGYAFAGQVATLNPSPAGLPAGWSGWDAAASGPVAKLRQVKQAVKRASYW